MLIRVIRDFLFASLRYLSAVNKLFLIFLTCIFFAAHSQNEFDKYGPPGSTVHTDLKEALKAPDRIYKADLSYKQVDEKLFEKINELKDLQALRINGIGISKLPPGFSSLRNLVYFASYNNKLAEFPGDLQNFGMLHCLDLQHTTIDSIPAAIAYLNRLQTFKFGNTDDTLAIPNTFRFLKNLQDLAIENCILDSFPKELFKISSLQFLYLSNTNTHSLSKHFERLPRLEVLIIENNPLTTVPFDIYKAQKLRFISFRGNKLTKLPDSISQLENLTVLDLRGNPFTKEEIEKLRTLLPGCEVRF